MSVRNVIFDLSWESEMDTNDDRGALVEAGGNQEETGSLSIISVGRWKCFYCHYSYKTIVDFGVDDRPTSIRW